MARGGKGRGKPEVIVKSGVTRASGYLYFIDKTGDVARVKMARGGRRKKSSKKSAKKSTKKAAKKTKKKARR